MVIWDQKLELENNRPSQQCHSLICHGMWEGQCNCLQTAGPDVLWAQSNLRKWAAAVTGKIGAVWRCRVMHLSISIIATYLKRNACMTSSDG